ncbi:MAG TPA: outer membrane protein assembly factor BamA [Terriglobales bacterium]|nr:outer membrane protein assembly factor BamA [Terriglobales bacterium]
MAAALAACLLVLCPLLGAQENNIVQEILIHGNRRIPADTMRARIFTRPGDVYDEAALQRDFHSLWNTGYFEDIRIEREESPKGWRIHIYVKEKPTIRTIEYKGLNAISQSDVLDRFKERKVGLSIESQYDPTRVKKAEVTLKELEAEHGHQFANIRTEVHPIPPAAVGITFAVKEGPKVKVGRIKFEGNKHATERELRAAMKNLRPIGIPRSIFLENLFSKTFDASKLSEDADRVRDAYQQKGYFKALVEDPKTKVRDSRPPFIHIPFLQKAGKVVDITVPIEEGDRFKLAAINFNGNKAIRNTAALRGLFPMKDGELFNTADVRKGLENLRKAYGELGFINFTPVPETKIDDEKKLITLDIDIDEGKQFFVRRIEFQGNTTTRDKVIRRELAVEEGQVYNSRRWEFSLLRLNQLGYFEQLKPDQDTVITKNERDGTVDLTLKVREKGKNSIGLTGGVSGLAGGFIGFNYETNNFLGLGETLSLSANIGNRERIAQFGFTEPYLLDRPIQYGFTVYTQRYNFDQANQVLLATGTPLNLPQTVLNTLQNYTQSSTGFTTSISYALRHSLKRVGLTYSLDNTSIRTFSDASATLFQDLAFRTISGPNALNGVITSKLVPSFSYSTIDSPQRPHSGHSVFFGGEISGIGGNVRAIRPIGEYKAFRPVNKGRNVLGYRIQASFITGYAGQDAPPFERFYLGGENDLRGFDVRTISPVAFIPDHALFTLLNPDGTPVPLNPLNPRAGNATVNLPIHRIVFPGGDTSVVTNLEYRIPIVGPVAIAPFLDTGIDFAALPSQLRITPHQFTALTDPTAPTTSVFGCPMVSLTGCTGGVPGKSLGFTEDVKPLAHTNFVPRMSTGLELQVLAPIINQPFRIYYAYNPFALDTFAGSPSLITRSMFPVGAAGDFSFHQALAAFEPGYRLKEPRSTFRFTVSTTF